jgi:hypothetical protein
LRERKECFLSTDREGLGLQSFGQSVFPCQPGIASEEKRLRMKRKVFNRVKLFLHLSLRPDKAASRHSLLFKSRVGVSLPLQESSFVQTPRE